MPYSSFSTKAYHHHLDGKERQQYPKTHRENKFKKDKMFFKPI